jgi:hypothetical protein
MYPQALLPLFVPSDSERCLRPGASCTRKRKWAASDSALGSSTVMSDPYWAASTTCRACGGQSVAGSYLCARCRPIMGRIETRKDPQGRGRAIDKQARLRAMKAAVRPVHRRLPLLLHQRATRARRGDAEVG